MKLLPRTEFGNPILRVKAKKVSLSFLKSKNFIELKKNMIYTMRRSHGVGLAAPQIGKSLQIAVMEMRRTPTRPNIEPRGPIVIINPKITKSSPKNIADWEGCLSLKGVRALVPRPASITVEYMDEKGKKVCEQASGLWARIFQHEIDHLNGATYTDRIADRKSIMTTNEFVRRIVKKHKN